jgi:hypothetical protein
MPCQFGDDAHRQAVAFIGADITVERIDFAFREVRANAFPKRVERFGCDGTVGVTPVDVRFAGGFFDEELVFRRTACVRAGIDDQLSVIAKNTLAAPQRVFGQLGGRQVFEDTRGFDLLGYGKYRSTPTWLTSSSVALNT